MAWLSGLAGKAEEVLNNIDRGTAAVLKKEDSKRDFQNSEVVEVRSFSPHSRITVEEFLKDESKNTDSHVDLEKLNGDTNKITSETSALEYGDKFNLQSESLVWLDKASKHFDTNESAPDISNNIQYNNFHSTAQSNKHSYNIVHENKSESGLERFSQSKKENIKIIDKDKKSQAEYLKEIESCQEKINNLTSEKSRFIKEISNLTSTLEKTRFELNSVESELEQHRARALKTLQERDKLIAELRNSSEIQTDDTSVSAELNQLRQEHEILREEHRQIREKLRSARQESIDADLNSEKLRQKAIEASTQAREAIAIERRKRSDVEDDLRIRSQEVQSLQEELNHHHNTFTAKIQKQESEILKLKSQLSATAIPNSEIETRLTNLTRTLVLKQQELEYLTTDRNALRLRLEKLEHEYQNWRKNLPFNSINDTDDAKALLPSFLMESPFDTGVARRVKRAYSSLDGVGVQIGLFLRRYPLARILVLIYMALLQFWVLIVLFSESPEAH